MVTDLFLRSKAKVQATDLWLHPGGPDTGLPPTLSDSGTVTTLALFAGLGTLSELAAGEFAPDFSLRFITPESEFAESSIEREPEFALASLGRSLIG